MTHPSFADALDRRALHDLERWAAERTDRYPARDADVLAEAIAVYGRDPGEWPASVYEWASAEALLSECECGAIAFAGERCGECEHAEHGVADAMPFGVREEMEAAE